MVVLTGELAMSFFLRSGFRVHVAHLALLALLLQSTPSALGYTPPEKLSLSEEATPGTEGDAFLGDAFDAIEAGSRQAWDASKKHTNPAR
jgi:hypothetical protein